MKMDPNDIHRKHGAEHLRKVIDGQSIVFPPYHDEPRREGPKAKTDESKPVRRHADGTPAKFPMRLLRDARPTLNGLWAIKGLLPAKGLFATYGPSQTGKSFVVLDASMHLAIGREWAGRKVTQGSVIYIACEGATDFENRACALRDHLGAHDAPFAIVSVAPNLGIMDGDADKLIQEIKWAMEDYGWETVDYVVVDTLAQTMQGADENSPQGMGAFIANSQKISHAFNCLSWPVHHTGKDTDRGARGHSSLYGALDGAWETKANEDGSFGVCIAKMKGGETGPAWNYRTSVFDLGEDEDGWPVTTWIITDMGQPERSAPKAASKPKRETLACKTFREAFNEVAIANPTKRPAGPGGPLVNAVLGSRLKDEFRRRYPKDADDGDAKKANDLLRKQFNSGRDQLIKDGELFLENDGSDYWVWRKSP